MKVLAVLMPEIVGEMEKLMKVTEILIVLVDLALTLVVVKIVGGGGDENEDKRRLYHFYDCFGDHGFDFVVYGFGKFE